LLAIEFFYSRVTQTLRIKFDAQAQVLRPQTFALWLADGF
jgi:hypothetical protein